MSKIITIAILVLYAYTLISTISVLLLENRNPLKSISWVLVLLFLPVLGLFFYLLFGQNFRKQKVISKKSLRWSANVRMFRSISKKSYRNDGQQSVEFDKTALQKQRCHCISI